MATDEIHLSVNVAPSQHDILKAQEKLFLCQVRFSLPVLIF